jgi:serine/threonine protein kinase/Tfp pilus assembly protein PilF
MMSYSKRNGGRELTDEQRRRVDELLAAAMKRPAPEQVEFLRRAVAGDEPVVRDEAESLIVRVGASAGALVPGLDQAGLPAAPDQRSTADKSDPAFVADARPDMEPTARGETIGPYHILAELGEGGFGVVYLAERREPHVQRVALKVIKPGMETRAVIARFEQERQALAAMDHPNVATVYDAGETEDHRPYFVMEYVKGEPLTDYCDRMRLTVRDRLELFIQVCEAVQHAHHKGIIHRDLKPSNILVAEVEGRTIPKVIDFGVAKATSRLLTEKTIFTEQGQLIGTPEYMSPEQAEMGAIDVDTRTDVYSLGVLLYELLTGALPFDRKTLRAAGFAEIQRIIREVDPPRPSTKLSGLAAGKRPHDPSLPKSAMSEGALEGGSSHDAAHDRQTTLASLASELRRELEWIPLKAIRKDRAERYPTPLALAEDVRNYLEGRPLIAGPESAAYRVRTFVRRNRGTLTVAVMFLLLLAGGIAGTTSFAIRALDAEVRATTRANELNLIAEFQAAQLSQIDTVLMGVHLRRNLLEDRRAALVNAQVDAATIETVTASLSDELDGINFTNVAIRGLEVDILEPTLAAIERQFKDRQPLVEAHLLQAVADSAYDLGQYRSALGAQERALALRREFAGDRDQLTVESIEHMGLLLYRLERNDEAKERLEEALTLSRRNVGPEHRDTLAIMNHVGLFYLRQRKFNDAENHLLASLETSRRVLGDEDPDTITTLGSVAMLRHEQGYFHEASSLYEDAVRLQRKVLGDDDPITLSTINNLGGWYFEQGMYGEAEQHFREAYTLRRLVWGDDHPRTAISLDNLGSALRNLGRSQDAEQVHREALSRFTNAWGDTNSSTIDSMNNLASALMDQERYEEAEPYFRDALATSRRFKSADDPDTLKSIHNYGRALYALGRGNDAETLYLEALVGRRRAQPPIPRDLAVSLNDLSTLLRDRLKLVDAEAFGAEAVAIARANLPTGHPSIGHYLSNHARTLLQLGRFSEAADEGTEAYTIVSAAFDPSHGSDREAAGFLVELSEAWHAAEPGKGYDLKAAEWRAKLEALEIEADEPQAAEDRSDG